MEKFNFCHSLQVRYAEIDMQKIVFNANYLVYLDCAITDYFRNGLKLKMDELAETGTFDVVVAKNTMEFKSSASVLEWLDIWCRTSSIGTSSMTVEFLITKRDTNETVLTAEMIYVNRDHEAKRSKPIPEEIKEVIYNFESALTR